MQLPLREVELTSISRNDYGNKKLRDMLVSEHVTLGNDWCNLCRNKIARQFTLGDHILNSYDLRTPV